jgi:hypothetical protein
MKRKLIAIVLGSFVAIPALANDEIDAGNLPKDVIPTMTRDQVRAELIAAQRAGRVVDNAELGTLAKPPVQVAGKSRDQVRAELIAAQRAGDMVVNAETGLTARQMYSAKYAVRPSVQMRAGIGDTKN